MIAKQQSLKLFLQLWRTDQRKTTAGFTLTELLATILIGGIVISTLLAVIVEFLQTDQQEAARTQIQQEMKAALEYIEEDLRESVYIYPTINNLPNFGTNVTPVLAFWKAEPVEYDTNNNNVLDINELNCNSFSNANKKAECQALIVRRRAYSLVIYLQSTESNPRWEGKSRLLRYELPRYRRNNFTTQLETSTGFVDPVQDDSFPSWLTNNGSAIPTGSPDVLVDFVDDPTSNTASNLPTCPTDYTRTPSNAATNNSFFACVRDSGNSLGVNQDVILYLRGNAEGRGGLSSNEILPTLQSRITLRGVIDKFN